jgi:hypothetical protein
MFNVFALICVCVISYLVAHWQTSTYYNLQRSLDKVAKTESVEDRASLLAQVII